MSIPIATFKETLAVYGGVERHPDDAFLRRVQRKLGVGSTKLAALDIYEAIDVSLLPLSQSSSAEKFDITVAGRLYVPMDAREGVHGALMNLGIGKIDMYTQLGEARNEYTQLSLDSSRAFRMYAATRKLLDMDECANGVVEVPARDLNLAVTGEE